MTPIISPAISDEDAILRDCEKLKEQLRRLRLQQRAVLAEYENKLREIQIRKVKDSI